MRATGETSWSSHSRNHAALKAKCPSKQNVPETSNFPRGEFDELKKNFRAVQEENFKLQAVITDVTEVNKRWQKYNNDRQLYVQRLLSTIQDQQEQMNKIVENRVIHSKEVCDKAQDLNPTVEELIKERGQLREEVVQLCKQLEKLRKEHNEHVEVLEFQVKAHRDDWEAERSEKQQALHEKEVAERKYRELQRDLRNLKQKYREEKLQNSSYCKCCAVCTTTTEGEQCNAFLPGSRVNVCHKNHAKTYRTSVHVPCTSSPLLPRGTTIFFSDDLVVDGDSSEETTNTDEVSKSEKEGEEKLCNNNPTEEEEMHIITQTKDTEHNNNNCFSNDDSKKVPSQCRDNIENFNLIERDTSKNSFEVPLRKNSTAELNIELDSSSGSNIQHSAVRVTSTGSDNNIEEIPIDLGASGETLGNNGVTIGFDSSGLASVMGFTPSPIAKSSSLPEKKELRKEGVNPLVSRWSFDSYYSGLQAIASPPVTNNFGTSMDSLIEGRKSRSSSPRLTHQIGMSHSSSHKAPSWKVKYSEEGVATQTEDDVICPGCGQIFPPKMHLKFLDHFEKCQNSEEQKKSSKK